MPFLPVVIGSLVLIAGVFYEVFVVSIPFQDPPPALRRQYEADADFGAAVISLGGWIFLVGVGLLAGRWIARRVRGPR